MSLPRGEPDIDSHGRLFHMIPTLLFSLRWMSHCHLRAWLRYPYQPSPTPILDLLLGPRLFAFSRRELSGGTAKKSSDKYPYHGPHGPHHSHHLSSQTLITVKDNVPLTNRKLVCTNTMSISSAALIHSLSMILPEGAARKVAPDLLAR